MEPAKIGKNNNNFPVKIKEVWWGGGYNFFFHVSVFQQENFLRASNHKGKKFGSHHQAAF